MNRWKEYDAGKLTPPCVVQHDQIRDEHLVWVWDGEKIHGPISRTSFDEKEVFATVEAIKQMAEMPVEVVQDAKDIEIASLKEEVATLKSDKESLQADLAVAVAAVGISEKEIP